MHPLFQEPTPSGALRAPAPPHPASRRDSSDAIAGTNFSASRQPRVRAQLGTPARCVPVGRDGIGSHGFRFLGISGSRDPDVRGPNRKSFPWIRRAIGSNGKRYAESDEGQINRRILNPWLGLFMNVVARATRSPAVQDASVSEGSRRGQRPRRPSPFESLSFRASLSIARRRARRSRLPLESACVGVFALERLYDEPLPDRPRRGLDPHRAAVDKGGDLLDIGLDCPACTRRDLGAYPTEILGATAVTDPVASPGAGAGELADAGHGREYRGYADSLAFRWGRSARERLFSSAWASTT